MNELHTRLHEQKYLGELLVEAGLITANQLMTALDEQNLSGGQLEEILTLNGWIKQETIDVVMQNLILNKQASESQNQKATDLNKIAHLQTSNEFNSDTTHSTLHNFSVLLSPKKVLQYLFLLISSLCLISLIGQFAYYFLPDFFLRDFCIGLFNVNKEINIPSMYSAFALLFCSVILLTIAHIKKVSSQPYVPYWAGLGIVFFCLFLDESMSFHERLVGPVRTALNASGIFYFAWIIPGAIFLLTILLVFLKFIISLPAKIKRLFLTAGTVYVSGCIGMEMVSGNYASSYGLSNIIYNIFTTIEEFLEMFGVVIFIYALLLYITSYMKGMSINIKVDHSS